MMVANKNRYACGTPRLIMKANCARSDRDNLATHSADVGTDLNRLIEWKVTLSSRRDVESFKLQSS